MRLTSKSTIVSMLLFFIWACSVSAQSFVPVFDWVNRLQKGDEIEVTIKVTVSDFTVFRSKVSTISQNMYGSLLGDQASEALPQLEVVPKGLVKEYDINELLSVKEVSMDDGSKSWQKVEHVEIASYPIDAWGNFLREAISHGLREYENIDYKGRSYITLYFKRHGPSTVEIGNKPVKLTDEFYHFMKFARKYERWLPSEANSVILVHEPHWSLNGQYQLISGINALISSNSNYEYGFLVEGYYETETRFLPIEPITNRFSAEIPRAPQAFGLLQNFMIDGPMAYRIIHNPELPAEAIDDVKLIEQTPPESEMATRIVVIEKLAGLDEKLASLGASQAINEARLTLIDLFSYETASAPEIAGQDLIDYCKKVASLSEDLSERVKKLLKVYSSLEVREEIGFLDSQAAAYRNNAKRFEYALRRDRTMVDNISKHLVSEYAGRIPIVFIGSFHTAGMTSMLRSKGIGYIVIEPQSRGRVTKKEKENFNRALNPNTRQSYLANLAAGNLKLPVGPTRFEIDEYYGPYLTHQASEISTRITRRGQEIDKLIGSKIDYTSLQRVTNQNGNLVKASIGFGGAGNILPPSDFGSAFAHFDPQGDGHLFIYDEKDSKWQEKARYNFLAAAMLASPIEEFRDKTRKARFFHDRESGVLFFTIFDPESQKFYLFEGKKALDILPLISAPKPKEGEKEIPVHIELTILDAIEQEEKANGS